MCKSRIEGFLGFQGLACVRQGLGFRALFAFGLTWKVRGDVVSRLVPRISQITTPIIHMIKLPTKSPDTKPFCRRLQP